MCSHSFELANSLTSEGEVVWRTFCALICLNFANPLKSEGVKLCDGHVVLSFIWACQSIDKWRWSWGTDLLFCRWNFMTFIGGQDPGRGKTLYLQFSHWLVSPLKEGIPKIWEVQHQRGWTSTYTVTVTLLFTSYTCKNFRSTPKKLQVSINDVRFLISKRTLDHDFWIFLVFWWNFCSDFEISSLDY
jgi:hypothetical protein